MSAWIEQVISLAEKHSPIDGLTISSVSGLTGRYASVTYYSLGAGTDISQETYPNDQLFLIVYGSGEFHIDDRNFSVMKHQALLVEKGSLCGISTEAGIVYAAIELKEKTSVKPSYHETVDLMNSIESVLLESAHLKVRLMEMNASEHVEINGTKKNLLALMKGSAEVSAGDHAYSIHEDQQLAFSDYALVKSDEDLKMLTIESSE